MSFEKFFKARCLGSIVATIKDVGRSSKLCDGAQCVGRKDTFVDNRGNMIGDEVNVGGRFFVGNMR